MTHSKLRGLMAQSGMNQKDLGKLLNLSNRSINLKINGTREFRQSELEKLAAHFNVTIDEIVR